MKPLKVFELFSGIGGMHFALKETGLDAKVVRAIDINPLANEVYKTNFPDTVLLERNVQGLTRDDFDKLEIDMVMMSPPCQPFTRNGLRRDKEDSRNTPLLHIINLIPNMKTVKYILLENVQGFEISQVRRELTEALTRSGFAYQEFLLSPDQFAIPNSRLRYYLLAKRSTLDFCFRVADGAIMSELPQLRDDARSKCESIAIRASSLRVGSIRDASDNFLPDDVLSKYGSLLDIATADSTGTCCFTKSYGRYIEGTGSVFAEVPRRTVDEVYARLSDVEKGSQEYVQLLKSLRLRFFSPGEIARLMTFPDGFKFPERFTGKQKYKLLGNSVCVHVVAILTIILTS